MADDTEALARLHRALTGSDTLGAYPDTAMDHLLAALDAAWDLVEARGLTVPVIAGSQLGPWRIPDTLLGDCRQQVLARFAYDAASRPRTLAEAARQLEVLVAALDEQPVVRPPTLPAGESQGTLTWAADMSAAHSTAAGFLRHLIQRQWSGSIQNSTTPVPMGTAPEGSRGLVFHLPAGMGRLEVQPPVLQSMRSGEQAYVGFWFVGDAQVARTRDPWALIIQWHGNDNTSPHQILAVDGGDLITGNGKTLRRFYLDRVKPNTRYNVVMKVSATSGGPVTVWVNHEKVLDNYKAGLNNLPLYLKTGMYRQHRGSPNQTIWMGGHRVATGYGAAYPGGGP